MRRTIAGVAAVLLAGAACGDPTSRAGNDLTALQAAAEAVEDAGSSRMEMTMKMDLMQEVVVEMEGIFDYEEQVGRATMTFQAPAELPEIPAPTRMVIDESHVYMKGGLVDTYGIEGGGWIRLDVDDVPGAGGSQMNQNPSQYIDFLRGATEEIEEVGREDVRGVPTTRYSTEIMMEDILEHSQDENAAEYLEQIEELGGQVEPLSTDVWIDADGLPRRMDLSITISGVEGFPDEGMTMDVLVEMFDYGVEVDVDRPKRFTELDGLPGT